MSLETILITRREISACLLAALAGNALPQWPASAQNSGARLQFNLPPPGDVNSPSFEVFVALSQIVLMRTDLDLAFARRLFDLFLHEPWGPKHIGTAYAALSNIVTERAQRGGREAVEQASLPQGERWFVSHLAMTWYIGVYFHPERPTQWMTLYGAVMYEAAPGLLPTPYEESVGFGKWADPPAGGGKR